MFGPSPVVGVALPDSRNPLFAVDLIHLNVHHQVLVLHAIEVIAKGTAGKAPDRGPLNFIGVVKAGGQDASCGNEFTGGAIGKGSQSNISRGECIGTINRLHSRGRIGGSERG